MIKKIKKLCRLLCISALIGILLLPGQVMADRGGNSCRVRLPVWDEIYGIDRTMPFWYGGSAEA